MTRDRIADVRASADRAAERGLRVVDGADAARARRRHHQGARQRRPRTRAAWTARTAASFRSAATRACRAAPRSGAFRRSIAATAARWAGEWGFPVPETPGWTAAEMIEHSRRAAMSICSGCVGGNFLETLADVDRSREALRRPAPARPPGHRDLVVDAGRWRGDVLLLPAATRYESPGGGTETSTERRIIFSPEIPGRRIGSARPEWWVFREVMARARPEQRHLVGLEDAAAIRHEIARADAALQGHRDAARERRSGAVGRTDALRRRPLRHAGRQGAFCGRLDRPCPSEAAATRSPCRRAAASSSTRWCSARSIR